MESLNEQMLFVARTYLAMGYSPLRLHFRTKVAAVLWKELQHRPPTDDELVEWFSEVSNIALITGNGVVVVDVDEPKLLEQVIYRVGDTPMKCQTPSGGVHLYYSMRKGVHYGNAVKIRKREVDLRCEGAYAVCPWSQNEEGVPYRWTGTVVPPSELPPPRVSYLRNCKKKPIVQATRDDVQRLCNAPIITRGQKYIDTFDRRAQSGNNGHTTLFVAALKIVSFVRKHGGNEHDMWELLLYFNDTKCDPPWDLSIPAEERALQHKLSEALKKAK